MKQATRAVGIAESAGDGESTLAAAVVRADRTVDGLEYGRCTVGGLSFGSFSLRPSGSGCLLTYRF